MIRRSFERSFNDGHDRWRAIKVTPSPEIEEYVKRYGWWQEASQRHCHLWTAPALQG